MKWAFDDIRKFRKGDVWVDSFTGQSWFDPCVMDWKSEIIETDQDAFVTEAHFRPALVENKEEEERLLRETNKMIDNYKKLYGTKNRCSKE